MKRKIKKYDILVLKHKESGCWMGDHLVLSVKPEGIKLFSIKSKDILDYTLKQFSKQYEVRFYG